MKKQKEIKFCPRCRLEKPRTKEYWNYNSRGYPQPYCKACRCPSGLNAEARSKRASAKKYIKVQRDKSTFNPRFTMKSYKPVTGESMCHCCKTMFTPKYNSDRIFCSGECRANYYDYSRYQQFLGLQDFSR